jgi:hypothetical protein
VPKDCANSLNVFSNTGAPLTKLLNSCCTISVVATCEEAVAEGTPPKWTLSIIELDLNLINGIISSSGILSLDAANVRNNNVYMTNNQ